MAVAIDLDGRPLDVPRLTSPIDVLLVGDVMELVQIGQAPSVILHNGVEYRYWLMLSWRSGYVYLQRGWSERNGLRRLADGYFPVID